MTSFDEVRFPENIDFTLVGGPTFSTDIIEMFSGAEQRNQNWSQARLRFTASHVTKAQSDIDPLIAFFRARGGKARGFRFRDWTDYSAVGQTIGTGDGVITAFQLIKTYTSGGITQTRTITKPVQSGHQTNNSGAPARMNVYVDSVLKTEGTDYTVDYTTGIITFGSAPADTKVVTADFQFDVPVRFDLDTMSVQHKYSHEFDWVGISLVEIRI